MQTRKRTIFITGGAGFIGTNAAADFYREGWKVVVFDNLQRLGAKINLKWLLNAYDGIEFIRGDTRKVHELKAAFKRSNPDVILHLAGQVAVTTSVENPREDFECNALGTFNLLESAKYLNPKPFVLFSSTNKVYGSMEEIVVAKVSKRYRYRDYPEGISEEQLLDFHSPYGCSKGAADQYVRDYKRIYGLPSVVLRQSCIYGPHQFGVEDQGWLAWFTIAAMLGKRITIYGDGMQVRDVLYVDDLLMAYKLCIEKQDIVSGKVFNIGGGSVYTISLLELIEILEGFFKKKIEYVFDTWRPGDQKIYVSNIRQVCETLGWKPKITPLEGVKQLSEWMQENRSIIESAGRQEMI